MEQTQRRFGPEISPDYLAGIDRRPANVHEALAALETLTARFRRAGDARAAFPDIYAIITRRVSEEVRKPKSRFLEPAWIARLAGRFCERYIETLAWSLDGTRQDNGAWACAYTAAARPATLPIQDVMLGLSAHINYDLALGIAETIREHGHADDAEMLARYKHDHDEVNALLEASIPEAFARLVENHDCQATALIRDRAYRLASWTAMQLLQSWRAHVWNDVLALLGARTEEARAAVVRKMNRRSTVINSVLGVRLPAPIAQPRRPAVLEPLATVLPYRRPVAVAAAAVTPAEPALERLCA